VSTRRQFDSEIWVVRKLMLVYHPILWNKMERLPLVKFRISAAENQTWEILNFEPPQTALAYCKIEFNNT